MDAGASSSDDNHHHHDHAAHQHNKSDASAVMGKYSGSYSGESEDWNDSTSSSSEEESSSSSGDEGSGDSATEGSGVGDDDAEGETTSRKKRSKRGYTSKGNRNGTDDAGKGVKVQKEKKRREKDTSSDTRMHWNHDMVCRFTCIDNCI